MEKTYKRIIALTLIVLLVLPLCGCKKKAEVTESFTVEESESKAEESKTQKSNKKPKMDTEKVKTSESKATESKTTESKATESKAVESKKEEKVPTLTISSQPADFQMTKAQCAISFTVAVDGGKGDYTYTWYEKVDTTVSVVKQETKSDKTSNYGTVFKNDYFTGVGSITFYCEVKDASGQTVTSTSAAVKPFTPLKIVTEPTDVVYPGGQEENISVSVTVKGGAGPYTYKWISYRNNAETIEKTETSPNTTSSMVFVVELDELDYYMGGLGAYCIITDSAGNSVTTRQMVVTK